MLLLLIIYVDTETPPPSQSIPASESEVMGSPRLLGPLEVKRLLL